MRRAMPKPRQHTAWWPAIAVLWVLGPLVTWVVYRDMALAKPLWIGGLDSLIAFTACFWIVGRLAPCRGQGSGGIVWALSVCGWIFVIAGMAVAAEGRGVLEDFQLLAGSVWRGIGGLLS